MARMTGGQALVGSLAAHGVDTVFGLPGVQLDHLFNAFHDERNQVRVIHTRHEQGAGYLAFGYAVSTGKVGTYAVVPGPGFLNTTTALSTAYACNAPVLCIAGQIHTPFIGRGTGQLHEIPDQLGTMRGLTKWAMRAEHPTQVPELMREAFRQMGSGRVRPAGIEIPPDVLGLQCEIDLGTPGVPSAPPVPDPDLIDKAAALLGQAENPLIFVGGGIFGAEAELRALAEMLQAPVILSRAAGGALSDRHPLAHRLQAGHRLWGKADVVLGVGTRLFPQVPAWGVDGDLKLIRIDIDPTEVTRNAVPTVAITADARQALAALAGRLAAHNRRRASRADEMTTLKGEVRQYLDAKLGPQMAWLDALRAAMPDDAFFVEELTQVGYVARVGFPVYTPRTYVSSGYQGTLGYGFATALGVKIANPDRKVVSVSGDGGFMFNVQEMSTAVQQGLDVVAVVFNDGAYGNVRRMQQNDYGGRVIATELRNPDFVKLAESFGAAGVRAETPEALGAQIRAGLNRAGPTLIEVPMGQVPDPWPHLALGRARGR
ncbi:MAG: hypothetical protein EXQ87_09155 [Alphaproteobacteria bacterium]|nr:hypothetical protein [Alphaproteobacteria bacterium]